MRLEAVTACCCVHLAKTLLIKEMVVAGSSDQDNSLLSRILRRIPGFGGYVEQEARQASEEQTRGFVTGELQKTKSSVERYAKALVEAARIDDVSQCENVRNSVDAISQHLKSRLPGHSSFFGASRIDDDRLEDIYDCDVTLMDCAEELSELASRLSGANDESAKVLVEVREKVDTLKQKVANRDRLLSDL